MKTKIFSGILVVLLTALFVSTASAQTQDLMEGNITELETSQSIDLENLKQVFNDNTGQVPDFAASLIGNQTVVIELGDDFDAENNSIGFKMSNMKIQEIKWGSYNDTTLEITVTKDNLESILSANSPINKAGNMLENGELEYKAMTFGNKVRMGLFRLFTGF